MKFGSNIFSCEAWKYGGWGGICQIVTQYDRGGGVRKGQNLGKKKLAQKKGRGVQQSMCTPYKANVPAPKG